MALCRSRSIALGSSLLGAITLCVGCADDSGTTTGDGDGGGAAGGAGSGVGGATQSSSSTSASTSTSGSGGGGGGGAEPCIDTGPGEPNADEDSAYLLAPQEDADTIGSIHGVLNGPGDVDWYAYVGTDTVFGSVDPTATATVSDPTMQVCVFVECLSADTDPVTCGAASNATSPDGRVGCCAQYTVTVGNINCVNTSSEDTKVYIRVDSPAGLVCEEYQIEYHY